MGSLTGKTFKCLVFVAGVSRSLKAKVWKNSNPPPHPVYLLPTETVNLNGSTELSAETPTVGTGFQTISNQAVEEKKVIE
jgi:hypothetical protein